MSTSSCSRALTHVKQLPPAEAGFFNRGDRSSRPAGADWCPLQLTAGGDRGLPARWTRRKTPFTDGGNPPPPPKKGLKEDHISVPRCLCLIRSRHTRAGGPPTTAAWVPTPALTPPCLCLNRTMTNLSCQRRKTWPGKTPQRKHDVTTTWAVGSRTQTFDANYYFLFYYRFFFKCINVTYTHTMKKVCFLLFCIC